MLGHAAAPGAQAPTSQQEVLKIRPTSIRLETQEHYSDNLKRFMEYQTTASRTPIRWPLEESNWQQWVPDLG